MYCGSKGEDLGGDLHVFQAACFSYKWGEVEWANILGDFLEGSALTWYQSLPMESRVVGMYCQVLG